MPVVVAWELRFIATVALPIVAAVAGAQEPRDVPTFPSRTALVTADAVVVDDHGRPVRGLTAQDFTLAEDGKPQAIVTFEAFDLGAGDEVAATRTTLGPVATNVGPARASASMFVLLVDDMSLAPARQETARTALTRFLTDGARSGDELIFATTSGDAWWTAQMPEGREDLLALAARVRGRSLGDNGADAVSEWEAFRISHLEGRGDSDSDTSGAGGYTPPQPGQPARAIAGSSMTLRVVDRYYQRRVCIPDPLPNVPGNPPPPT